MKVETSNLLTICRGEREHKDRARTIVIVRGELQGAALRRRETAGECQTEPEARYAARRCPSIERPKNGPPLLTRYSGPVVRDLDTEAAFSGVDRDRDPAIRNRAGVLFSVVEEVVEDLAQRVIVKTRRRQIMSNGNLDRNASLLEAIP